jgi:tRNA threonylcarbamoyladenosine biosynthesis protein TsaB
VRVLGIDTASRVASVGVCETGVALVSRALPASSSHASSVLPGIDEVLRSVGLSTADLDLLAVTVGPGSFTGLRVGLSTAKGLALATGLPLVGVPTLVAYARAAGARPGWVWPVLDARKGEVYAGAFRWHGDAMTCEQPAAVLTPGALAERVQTPATLLGDGVDAYGDFWRGRFGSGAEYIGCASLPPTGAVVACLGAELARSGAGDVHGLAPVYCRAPEAVTRRADPRLANYGTRRAEN